MQFPPKLRGQGENGITLSEIDRPAADAPGWKPQINWDKPSSTDVPDSVLPSVLSCPFLSYRMLSAGAFSPSAPGSAMRASQTRQPTTNSRRPATARSYGTDLLDYVVDPMGSKAGNHHRGFERAAFDVVGDGSEPVLSRHSAAPFPRRESWRQGPDVAGALVAKIMGLMQLAAGDECHGMRAGGVDPRG